MADGNTYSQKTIGDLNGRWSILFRGVLSAGAVAMPFLVMVNAWQISSIQDLQIHQEAFRAHMAHYTNLGPRYTAEMAERDRLRDREIIMQKLQEMEREMSRMSARLENFGVRQNPEGR